MSHHIPGPWGLRLVHDGHKVTAVIVQTMAPNQPCNDPVLLALREDWLSIASLPDNNPRKASLNLLLKAPDLSSMLQRLAEKTRRANEIQKSGGDLVDEDWAELRQLTSEAFDLLHQSGQGPTSVSDAIVAASPRLNPGKRTAWLAFALHDGERFEESLHATEAEAVGAILKALQQKADAENVPSLAEAIEAPEDYAPDVNLNHYVNLNPAWQGHLEWLTAEQDLALDAWILELNLPENTVV